MRTENNLVIKLKYIYIYNKTQCISKVCKRKTFTQNIFLNNEQTWRQKLIPIIFQLPFEYHNFHQNMSIHQFKWLFIEIFFFCLISFFMIPFMSHIRWKKFRFCICFIILTISFSFYHDTTTTKYGQSSSIDLKFLKIINKIVISLRLSFTKKGTSFTNVEEENRVEESRN